MNLLNGRALTLGASVFGVAALGGLCNMSHAQTPVTPPVIEATSDVWKATAKRPIAPLHGNITKVTRNGKNLTLETVWNRAFEGKVWVGFAQNGALYSAQSRTVKSADKSQISLALPTNLPAGRIEIQLVPLHQPVAATANSFLALPKAEGDAKAFPRAWGVYRDVDLVMHPWTVSQGNMMVWDGEPYIPVGGMVNFRTSWMTKAGESDEGQAQFYGYQFVDTRLEEVKKYGLRDIYFNGFFQFANPNALAETIAITERKGMRYGISVATTPTHFNNGFLARVAPIEVPANATSVEIRTPIEASKVGENHRCIWALLGSSGQVLQTGKGVLTPQAPKKPAENGQPEIKDLVLNVQFAATMKGTGQLIYSPEVPMSGSDPTGYFDVLDRHIAELKQVYGSLPLGAGMRMWIDPFGNEMHSDARQLSTSKAFRDGFKNWLFKKYGDVAKLNADWNLATQTGVTSFDQASRLVPFYEQGGLSFWMEVETGKVFQFKLANSEALRDLALYRGEVAQDCLNRVSDVLKEIADVPVIFKHNTWFSDWFVNPQKAGGFDGVGYEPYCYGDSLAYHNSLVAYAEVAAAGRSQWSIVTETSPAAFDGQKDYVGYIDRMQMLDDFDQMLMFGAKGIYTFGFVFDPGANFQVTELLRDPRQLEWMATYAKTLQAAAPKLANFRPEVHGWYPAYLREKDIVRAPVNPTFGSLAPKYAMDGMYLGIPSQIRMAPDGRWIVPALRPDANWKSVLAADPLLTPTERKSLNAIKGQRPVHTLGEKATPTKKNPLPLNGFTANGIGVIPKDSRAMTLDEFRRDVLGYRVFRTVDINGQTLPDGRVMVWTCIERDKANLKLPANVKAENLKGEAITVTTAANGTGSLTLTRPPYEKSTELPPFLNFGYYYPDLGQPEVAILSGVKVDDILRLNTPDWQRWLTTSINADDVAAWQEAENAVSTTFVQPRVEGYGRYSGGSAIGMNTHFEAPTGQNYYADYRITTNQAASKLWIRRMDRPAMNVEVWIDGKKAGTLAGNAKNGTDALLLNPWNAGLGLDQLKVAWYPMPLAAPLVAGVHNVKLVAVRSQVQNKVDTKLLGGQAEQSATTGSNTQVQGLQIDVLAFAR